MNSKKIIPGVLRLLTLLIAVIAFVSCDNESEQSRAQADNPLLRTVKAKEVKQTTSYTYIHFKEGSDSYWAAISRRDDIEEGGTYYFDNFMEMQNFYSKELDKTFDRIYFIEVLSNTPISAKKPKMPQQTGSTKVGDYQVELVDPAEDGITIAELFGNRESYDGKLIRIRGKVVKFTPAIMKKNWVHIQDGTKWGGDFDLTITTSAECSSGDIVVFEGIVTLNKDFGHGYSYDVILEDATMLEIDKSTTLQ